MERKNFNLYHAMLNYSEIIAMCIKESLEKSGAKVYTCDVFVGRENDLTYECYIEFVHPNTGYKFIHGDYLTVENINKRFRTNLKGVR